MSQVNLLTRGTTLNLLPRTIHLTKMEGRALATSITPVRGHTVILNRLHRRRPTPRTKTSGLNHGVAQPIAAVIQSSRTRLNNRTIALRTTAEFLIAHQRIRTTMERMVKVPQHSSEFRVLPRIKRPIITTRMLINQTTEIQDILLEIP